MDNTIHATVRQLEWMPIDPDLGERLALRIAAPDGDGADSEGTVDGAAALKRARAVINGLPAGLRSYDGLRQEYRILLDALPELRMLARRWPALAKALAALEARDPEFEHQHRQLRWRKLRSARWEQEERQRQASARQAHREEREQRERERAQRQSFAQRAWQRRGLPSLPPEVAAAFSELSLLPSAPADMVDLAFRYFARRAHPDLADQYDEAERLRRTERMKHLNRSHEILVDYFARLAAQGQR